MYLYDLTLSSHVNYTYTHFSWKRSLKFAFVQDRKIKAPFKVGEVNRSPTVGDRIKKILSKRKKKDTFSIVVGQCHNVTNHNVTQLLPHILCTILVCFFMCTYKHESIPPCEFIIAIEYSYHVSNKISHYIFIQLLFCYSIFFFK